LNYGGGEKSARAGRGHSPRDETKILDELGDLVAGTARTRVECFRQIVIAAISRSARCKTTLAVLSVCVKIARD